MISSMARLVLLVCCLCPAVLRAAEPDDVKAVAERIGPSIVRLSNVDRGEEAGHGSGFFVADGVIATNHHVIDAVDGDLRAVLRDGKKLTVLGSLADDEVHDLALVRVEGSGQPVLPLAPSDEIHVGERVIAVGSPLGFDQTVSIGIVSALRDDYPEEWKKHDPTLKGRGKAGPLVQHTASIAPGSSGSPLVDDQGRVVGVNHSRIEQADLFFAAHADALRALLAKTDLKAPPKPLGPNVRRNLLISGGAFALLALVWLLAFRRRK
jgi:S1-C subfamily serine protease